MRTSQKGVSTNSTVQVPRSATAPIARPQRLAWAAVNLLAQRERVIANAQFARTLMSVINT